MAKYTKQQAISIITDCAVKYKENLDGYQLLFILKDKHKHISSLEVSFNPYNFLHLTGIKLADKTTATDFYERCLNHKLSPDDFSFAPDGTTQLKLEILPQLMVKNSFTAPIIIPCTKYFCKNGWRFQWLQPEIIH